MCQPTKTLKHLLSVRSQRNRMNSADPITKIQAEMEFRSERLAEAIEELDAKVQHLEARLDSLILILQRLDSAQMASSSEEDQESS